MTEISANIRLRPTRIGFLVSPTDMRSIKRIMQFNACVWGGDFNPIIPVYKTPPKEWRADKHESVKGLSVARGYIKFFEPDVYVEAQKGLLEKAGLGALRQKHTMEPEVCTLGEFLKVRDRRDFSEPFYGLNVVDVFRHLYKTEQRFEHRDKRASLDIKPDKNNGLAEAVFGVYPGPKHADYIRKGYEDVFMPEKAELTPETWLRVFSANARTPLRVTRHGLDFQRNWYHDPIIYIFDPSRPTDLIDYWNMRLEPCPVLPVPVNWVGELSDFIQSVLKQEHRPVQGNPNGIMHRGTIEFGRSVPREKAEEIVTLLSKDMPKGTVSVKFWRNRIWTPQDIDFVKGHEVLKVTASEVLTNLPVKEDEKEITSRFETLSPEFASQYGGHNFRWVNAVQVSAYGSKNLATVFPYNTYNREWPRLGLLGGDRVIVGSEGWVFAQRFKNSDEALKLIKKEDAVIGTLEQLGVKAKLSDPGHIAKQVLDHLGGLWGVYYLANSDVVQLLNKMAMSVRRKRNQEDSLEEHFSGRTASVEDWKKIVKENNNGGSVRDPKLKDYTDRNVIRLGLETICPHCQGRNWHGLRDVDYKASCERCLNEYDFPQADSAGRKWKYRVVGPFSIPDYARGAYSSLLTLRAIDSLRGHKGEMTFSTALDLEFDGIKCEADFVAIKRKERIEERLPPELIIGECKSFGKGELIKNGDLTKLKHVAKKLPGAVIVISVMRDHFTKNEKKIITQFVKWAERPDQRGRATNPVVLFTGNELFYDFLLSATWQDLGSPHKDYTDYEHTKDLSSLSQATQAIYLGLPSRFDRRAAKRKARAKKT
jgi:hypothetical protein